MDYAGDKKCLSFHPPEWKIGRTLQFIVFQLSQRQCAESSEAHDIRLVVNISSKSWSSLVSFIVSHCCERPWPSICTKTILKASILITSSHIHIWSGHIGLSRAEVPLQDADIATLEYTGINYAEYMTPEKTIYTICYKNIHINMKNFNTDHASLYLYTQASRRNACDINACNVGGLCLYSETMRQ